MELKIAVCDDEPTAIRQIDTYLTQIQQETKYRFQTFYFSSGEDLIEHMPRDVKIVLLDIQMADLSGIETAKKLRSEALDFYLFFITNNTQYALEGYSAHAYAFLSKPLQYAQFKAELTEVLSKLERRRPSQIEIKNGTTSVIVNSSDLIYVEVYGHVLYFTHDDGSKIVGKMPLDKVELSLSSYGFFRSHKSYLINLKKIKSFGTTEIVMSDGTVVPLSRNRKREFLIALHEAMEDLI